MPACRVSWKRSRPLDARQLEPASRRAHRAGRRARARPSGLRASDGGAQQRADHRRVDERGSRRRRRGRSGSRRRPRARSATSVGRRHVVLAVEGRRLPSPRTEPLPRSSRAVSRCSRSSEILRRGSGLQFVRGSGLGGAGASFTRAVQVCACQLVSRGSSESADPSIERIARRARGEPPQMVWPVPRLRRGPSSHGAAGRGAPGHQRIGRCARVGCPRGRDEELRAIECQHAQVTCGDDGRRKPLPSRRSVGH